MIEILHFRGSDKILNDKNMMHDVQTTLEYLADVLTGVQFKGELFRQALDDMGWRENGTLNVIPGRRYMYKGFKKNVAIEGNFSAYEYSACVFSSPNMRSEHEGCRKRRLIPRVIIIK